MKRKGQRLKKLGVAGISAACILQSGSFAVFGEAAPVETEAAAVETETAPVETEAAAVETETAPVETEAAGENALEGQLTLEEISAMNGGEEKVFSHNGRVTFVEGTCSETPLAGEEDAAAVVKSMLTLIGADESTRFVPWRTVTDPLGNHYYIFQQMYQDTTVCGGAVKVITDAEGEMIGLTSSVESGMPEDYAEEKITAGEAEQIVRDYTAASEGKEPALFNQYTNTVILPSSLKYDIEEEVTTSRFAWVVYTDNPSGNVLTSSDLPYLAHYVSMDGEYLYNMPAIAPDDEAGRSGYDAGYVFEFMEPAEYTGYVDLSDGTEKEISVTVMRDKRTGMYYLGNIERRIVVAQCYDFLYNDGQVVLESSPDNLEWDQVGLLSLYNYCRAWDYYNEIGWTGGDGENTPIIILNNFCDDHFNEVNNACYVGKVYGMQAFLASKINDLSQCLDVIAHEFTHCVTGSVMTYNSYMNDYGAINEAMSDIQGKNCAMMAGDSALDDWILGSDSVTPVRSMSDPHVFTQPEFTWDLYYIGKVETPTAANDHGGVHFNSSLLNQIGYYLVDEGGMTLEEARTFWFMADCAMVPGTDYAQLAELLPFILKAAGMEQYSEILAKAISVTRLGEEAMPETIGEDRALIKLTLPMTEAFDTGNWMMSLTSIKLEEIFESVKTIVTQLLNKDFSSLPASLREALEANEEQEKAEAEKEESGGIGGFLSALAEALAPMSEEEEQAKAEAQAAAEEEADAMMQDVLQWLLTGLRENVFQSIGVAGQDGSTVMMVVRPGRSIPILQHMTLKEGSQEPDQLVFAVYIHGKWYGLDFKEMEKYQESQESQEEMTDDNPMKQLIAQIMTDVFGENMENLENMDSLSDILDLFTVEIHGGEILELSAEGLEEISIPEPTPFEEKSFGTIQPGKKSRPKLETEAAEEAAAIEGKEAAEEAAMEETAAEALEETSEEAPEKTSEEAFLNEDFSEEDLLEEEPLDETA